MKKKSKLLTFLLSFFMPGVGHMYLGMGKRGLLFLFGEIMFVIFTIIMGTQIPDEVFIIPLILGVVLWIVCLIDSMIMNDKVNFGFNNFSNGQNQYNNFNDNNNAYRQNNYNVNGMEQDMYNKDINDNVNNNNQDNHNVIVNTNYSSVKSDNRRSLAMILSIMPGAGHMYIGLIKQGIQLMLSFFMCIYLASFFNTNFFAMFLPVIWFFGMFDIFNKLSSDEKLKDENLSFINWFVNKAVIKNSSRLPGIVLIAVGVILIFEKVFMRGIRMYLGYNIGEYLRISIVALLFIYGGIRLLKNVNIHDDKAH